MQIREGAYYRTRGGDVVGPMKQSKVTRGGWASNSYNWYGDGRFPVFDYTHDLDLISEVYVSDTPPDAAETVRFNPTAELQLVRPNDLLLKLQNTPPVTGPNSPLMEVHDRKTLRDEFAMEAMKLLFPKHGADWVEVMLAIDAYKQADAMMGARKK